MNKIEFESKEKVKVGVVIGQIYRPVDEYNNDPYIVSQIGSAKYCLINLVTGNRWSEPTPTIDDIFNGGGFTLVTEPFKVIPNSDP